MIVHCTSFALKIIKMYFNLNSVLYSKDHLAQLYSKTIIAVWVTMTYILHVNPY